MKFTLGCVQRHGFQLNTTLPVTIYVYVYAIQYSMCSKEGGCWPKCWVVLETIYCTAGLLHYVCDQNQDPIKILDHPKTKSRRVGGLTQKSCHKVQYFSRLFLRPSMNLILFRPSPSLFHPPLLSRCHLACPILQYIVRKTVSVDIKDFHVKTGAWEGAEQLPTPVAACRYRQFLGFAYSR